MLSQYLMLAAGIAAIAPERSAAARLLGRVFERAPMLELLRLNRDILIRTLCLVCSFAIFINFSSVLGIVTLAANSILLRLFTLAAYLIDGAAFATESLAGIFRGARDLVSLRRLRNLSLLSGLGFSALFLAALLAATGGPLS